MSPSPAPLGEFSNWLNRLTVAFFMGGQVFLHLLKAKLHRRNTLEQMKVVGPDSLSIALLTSGFVGMVMTIQLAREFIKYGATSTVGGFLALALARELAPVLTAVVVAGRVGSAFAAEIGTMRVTEQIDALYMMRTDPIDYLVVPRVFACGFMMPILSVMSLIVGLLGGLLVADSLYGIPPAVFLKSVRDFLEIWDIASCMIKALIFGCLIAVIGCSWGLTTTGGAKGVGQSTTTAVVTSLLAIFVANFFLSWVMYQGLGQAKSG